MRNSRYGVHPDSRYDTHRMEWHIQSEAVPGYSDQVRSLIHGSGGIRSLFFSSHLIYAPPGANGFQIHI